jgi:hypothetical protein
VAVTCRLALAAAHHVALAQGLALRLAEIAVLVEAAGDLAGHLDPYRRRRPG